MTNTYTIYRIADITDEIQIELDEQYDLHFVQPRKCNAGIWAIVTGVLDHPKVSHYYLTQKEAEQLMQTPEWSRQTDDNINQ
ncbi:hypothetical protein [Endozoicomonas euniceicola]|uniref:Uncharacterized protein n=1 Tax=Endozoicomonas euniceicola TaxID=1234143 RepID=A0ABY6GNF4_9GAMM|nr:hypothetical protein [Endozoicomonas euniceicola]UYM14262.1 hypothetical protein NX720_15295 [Endozoicomonas euniceicola]